MDEKEAIGYNIYLLAPGGILGSSGRFF